MRTILCTTGTSLASMKDCPALAEYHRTPRVWDDPAEDLRSQIRARLNTFDLAQARDRIRASAEINSLHRLGLNSEDRIVLIATDTADGRACAELLAEAIRKGFGLDADRIRVERVMGLQVRDAALFRNVGIVQLVDCVLKYVTDPQVRHGSEVILNPTGGFKSVVPFLTILGMLFQLRTVYVFEFSEALIHLPPLPVSFDLDLYERARPALSWLQREGAGPVELFFRKVTGFQGYERDLFASFLEVDGTLATLSPLALVLVRLDEQAPHDLMISPEIQRQIEDLNGPKRTAAERFLSRLSQPLWRSSHGHGFAGTDLNVTKPGNVAIRAAWQAQEDKVYVCGLYQDHDDYERDLNGRRRRDFDLTRFVPWTPPKMQGGIESSAGDPRDAQLEALLKERDALRSRLDKFNDGSTAGPQSRIARLESELAEARRTIRLLRSGSSGGKFRKR